MCSGVEDRSTDFDEIRFELFRFYPFASPLHHDDHCRVFPEMFALKQKNNDFVRSTRIWRGVNERDSRGRVAV